MKETKNFNVFTVQRMNISKLFKLTREEYVFYKA